MKVGALTKWYEDKVYPLETGDFARYRTGNKISFDLHESCYIIYNDKNDLFKIGITVEPEKRLRTLETQSGSMCQKVLLIYLEGMRDESSKIVESKLHEYFSDKRKIGEWFDLNVLDLLQINHLFYQGIGGHDIFDNLFEFLPMYKKKEFHKILEFHNN